MKKQALFVVAYIMNNCWWKEQKLEKRQLYTNSPDVTKKDRETYKIVNKQVYSKRKQLCQR